MLKQILNDDLLIDGDLKVNNNEIIYTVNKKQISLSSDLQYRLLLQGFNQYQSKEAKEYYNAPNLHYVIENMDFFRPVVLLSNGNSTIEFINCYFHSTINILKADKVILDSCKYYINSKTGNINKYQLVGHVNSMIINNDDKKHIDDFNISLYAEDRLELNNSKIERNMINLYSKNINITNSMVTSTNSDICSENVCIKDSNIKAEDLKIKSNNMDLLNSNIIGTEKLSIYTESECDLNLFDSPNLDYNCMNLKQKLKTKK